MTEVVGLRKDFELIVIEDIDPSKKDVLKINAEGALALLFKAPFGPLIGKFHVRDNFHLSAKVWAKVYLIYSRLALKHKNAVLSLEVGLVVLIQVLIGLHAAHLEQIGELFLRYDLNLAVKHYFIVHFLI